jgi:hypothetical protein
MMPPKTPVSIDGADAHGGEEDDVTHRAGQGGDAVVFRQTDRHADGEEQRQTSEDRAASRGHDLRDRVRQPRKVRAAHAEQNAGDRQHGYRQHHALADFLQDRERLVEGRHG